MPNVEYRGSAVVLNFCSLSGFLMLTFLLKFNPLVDDFICLGVKPPFDLDTDFLMTKRAITGSCVHFD